MKSALKTTTAHVALNAAPKAQKVEDNGEPISNPVVRKIEQEKQHNSVTKATAKGEIAALVGGVSSEMVVSDTAGGRARAMAIVTLCLMRRHRLVTEPTKAELGDTDGRKDYSTYLAEAFKRSDLDWDKEINKSAGVENTWREALAGFTWLNKVGCLRLDLSEDENGEYAHLGMLKEDSMWVIALDINKMAAAGVKIDGKVVKADGGIRRASAAEVIKFGQDLLNSAEYWEKTGAGKTLDVIGEFAAYVTAIANGQKPDNGPTIGKATLDRLSEVAVTLSKAIEYATDQVAAIEANKAAMKAEASKTTEQKAVDAAPKLTAAEKRKAKLDAENAKRIAAKFAAEKAEAEKQAAKVTFLKTRKAKSTLRTAKRKAA